MLRKFKSSIERELKIAQWAPTDRQLLEIALYINEKPNELDNLSSYICENCDDVLLMCMEGQDYSDLRVLLALAKKVAEEVE